MKMKTAAALLKDGRVVAAKGKTKTSARANVARKAALWIREVGGRFLLEDLFGKVKGEFT